MSALQVTDNQTLYQWSTALALSAIPSGVLWAVLFDTEEALHLCFCFDQGPAQEKQDFTFLILSPGLTQVTREECALSEVYITSLRLKQVVWFWFYWYQFYPSIFALIPRKCSRFTPSLLRAWFALWLSTVALQLKHKKASIKVQNLSAFTVCLCLQGWMAEMPSARKVSTFWDVSVGLINVSRVSYRFSLLYTPTKCRSALKKWHQPVPFPHQSAQFARFFFH